MYIKRHIEKVIDEVGETYPAVLVTGARQVGKSTVLRKMFPREAYETLDDLAMLNAIESDPLGFLKMRSTPLILDEIQKCPALLSSIKYNVDTERKNGMYYLTGSQKFELMKGVSESLAGRIDILTLFGLSTREIKGETFDLPFLPTMEYLKGRSPIHWEQRELWETIYRGSMPALYENKQKSVNRYYADYVATYIERDVRQLSQVGDTLTFIQFMTALASRTGEMLNMNSLATDIGVSAPTIKKWISVLQASNVVYLLQPFSLNTEKRVIKTPKIYFTDTGLVCYLCKWLTPESLANGAQAGAIYETYVINEIMKSYLNAGLEGDFYYFRTREGQEVDLIIYRDGKLYPIEIKKTSSPNEKDIRHFSVLKETFPTVTVAEGGIVCNAPKLLPLGANAKIVPIEYV